MWNWASGKEASSLVSSIHNKLVGAVPQTFLNWVILFLRLLILRYPTTGLLVHNVLKFVSSSMSRLWFVFLTLSLFWLVTLSRCFLKSALKELILFALVWKKCYWVKNCVEIFGKCDRMILMILFSDAVALLHIIISEYLIKFLVNCKILLPFKCNPLLLRWLLLVFPFSVMPICNLRKMWLNISYFHCKVLWISSRDWMRYNYMCCWLLFCNKWFQLQQLELKFQLVPS